jgi:hypothetical protein
MSDGEREYTITHQGFDTEAINILRQRGNEATFDLGNGTVQVVSTNEQGDILARTQNAEGKMLSFLSVLNPNQDTELVRVVNYEKPQEPDQPGNLERAIVFDATKKGCTVNGLTYPNLEQDIGKVAYDKAGEVNGRIAKWVQSGGGGN